MYYFDLKGLKRRTQWGEEYQLCKLFVWRIYNGANFRLKFVGLRDGKQFINLVLHWLPCVLRKLNKIFKWELFILFSSLIQLDYYNNRITCLALVNCEWIHHKSCIRVRSNWCLKASSCIIIQRSTQVMMISLK